MEGVEWGGWDGGGERWKRGKGSGKRVVEGLGGVEETYVGSAGELYFRCVVEGGYGWSLGIYWFRVMGGARVGGGHGRDIAATSDRQCIIVNSLLWGDRWIMQQSQSRNRIVQPRSEEVSWLVKGQGKQRQQLCGESLQLAVELCETSPGSG